jgi:hypothetical protein
MEIQPFSRKEVEVFGHLQSLEELETMWYNVDVAQCSCMGLSPLILLSGPQFKATSSNLRNQASIV